MKRCFRCDLNKPVEDFYRDTKNKDGRYSWCKPCSVEAKRASNRRLKERDPERHAEMWRTYKKRYEAKHPDRIRAGWRKQNLKKFGITPDDFERMKTAQGGVCKICSDPPPEFRDLAVDHCHTTGRVRGLLCGRCNTAIGLLRDDIELAKATIDYLTREEAA